MEFTLANNSLGVRGLPLSVIHTLGDILLEKVDFSPHFSAGIKYNKGRALSTSSSPSRILLV